MDQPKNMARFDARMCASNDYASGKGLSEAIVRACNHTCSLYGITAGIAEIVREQYALAEADSAAREAP